MSKFKYKSRYSCETTELNKQLPSKREKDRTEAGKRWELRAALGWRRLEPHCSCPLHSERSAELYLGALPTCRIAAASASPQGSRQEPWAPAHTPDFLIRTAAARQASAPGPLSACPAPTSLPNYLAHRAHREGASIQDHFRYKKQDSDCTGRFGSHGSVPGTAGILRGHRCP